MTLSDDDFARISALHDGELDPAEETELRARLNDEPDLRSALEEVETISAALKSLRPKQAAGTVTASGTHRLRHIAAAACLALAAGALFMDWRQAFPETALDWHEYFVSQSYILNGELQSAAATEWIGSEPDLSAANLTLVDISNRGPSEAYMHYSGVNGCRLTFGIHDAEPEVPHNEAALLLAVWTMGERHYTVFALGMDRNRFEAIATLLKEKVRQQQPVQEHYAQVRDATKNAVPCV